MAGQKAKAKRKPGKKYTNDAAGKAEKFRDFANKRYAKLAKAINQIGNLSGNSYASTPEEVSKMFKAIRAKLDAAESRFSKTKTATAEEAIF